MGRNKLKGMLPEDALAGDTGRSTPKPLERLVGKIVDGLPLLDRKAVDLGRPGEVELVERLEHGEAGQPDASGACPVLAQGRLPR